MGHSQAARHLLLLLSPSLAPCVMHSCLGPCCCWCSIAVEGGPASLNSRRTCTTVGCITLGIHLYKVQERILTVTGRGQTEYATVLSFPLSTGPSAPSSMIVTDWAWTLMSPVVRDAAGRASPLPTQQRGFHSILQIVGTSRSVLLLYLVVVVDGLIWEPNAFLFK